MKKETNDERVTRELMECLYGLGLTEETDNPLKDIPSVLWLLVRRWFLSS
jgi:hypothetical protein